MTTTAPKNRPALSNEECSFLLAWMREECQVREKLTRSIDSWGDALIRPRESGLLRKMEAVKPLLDHLAELDRRRESLCNAITTRLGLGARKVKISALIGIAPPNQVPALKEAREALQASLKKSSMINRRNTLVARSGLEFNRALLRTAFGDGMVSQTYDHHAATQDAPSTTTYLNEEL